LDAGSTPANSTVYIDFKRVKEFTSGFTAFCA
jgi:hypothetical protein